MPDEKSSTQGDGMIAKLIAAAGPGPTASPEAKERIYSAVRARWEATAAGPAADRRNRHAAGRGSARRRRFNAVRMIGMAAAVAAVAVSLSWLTSGRDTVPTATELAQYTFVAGQIEIRHRAASAMSPITAGTTEAILAGDTLRTGDDGRAELRRPDGLLLRMNTSTEIRFSALDEIDLVAGTIYIDSGDGARGRALEVTTPLGDVEHVGTQYEVRLADTALRIRVREGQVAYRGATEAVGVAGEQLEIDAAGSTERSSISRNDPAWSWATSLATLPAAEAYRLDETLDWIGRELGYEIDYADAGTRRRVAGQTIVGLEGLSPTEALAAIEQIAGLQTEISGDRLIVSN